MLLLGDFTQYMSLGNSHLNRPIPFIFQPDQKPLNPLPVDHKLSRHIRLAQLPVPSGKQERVKPLLLDREQ